MPLSPAEVHNVAFKKPPIGKRGYDEEEVDAFLDVVEVELSRLIEENNDLKGRGGNGASPVHAVDASPDGTGAVATTSADEALSAELASVKEDNEQLQSRIAELESQQAAGEDGPAQGVVQLQQEAAENEQLVRELQEQLDQARLAATEAQEAGSKAAAAPATTDVSVQAVQMLALAQQTADQHLAQSKAEADRLVTEAMASAETTLNEARAIAEAAVTTAQSQAEASVAEAQARASKLDEDSTSRAAHVIQEAEQRANAVTAQLEQRKIDLERRVEELGTFEREYRSRLKSYLQSQLRDLDAGAGSEPVDGAAPHSAGLADAQQS